jgi:hypothetical protein
MRSEIMRREQLAIVLSMVSLALVLGTAFMPRMESIAAAEAAPGVLRAQAIELVDDAGQVRAQLNVEPDGEAVLRLRGEKGTIRVKLGAKEAGSGLILMNDETDPAIHMIANESGTSVTLLSKDKPPRVIEP